MKTLLTWERTFSMELYVVKHLRDPNYFENNCALIMYRQVLGTSVAAYKDLPLLEVRLRDSVPEAFEMILHYIYTDHIDPTKKSIKERVTFERF